MPYTKDDLLKLANDHGYFLQQAVEQTIKAASTDHNFRWNVVSSEHYWKHEATGDSGYADLIIEHAHEATIGVIECKRYSQETAWIFLCPDQREELASPFTTAHWIYSGSGDPVRKGWGEFTHLPRAYTAKYCVIKNLDHQKPMLERIAGNLLYAVEAIGAQYLEYPKLVRNSARLFLPLIVTTASLRVCKYKLSSLDATTGTLAIDDCEIVPVDYVRFHKVITDTDVPVNEIHWFARLEEMQSQTLFVVHASAIARFLSKCQRFKSVSDTRNPPWFRV